MSNPETPENFRAEIIKRLEKQHAGAAAKLASVAEHLRILRAADKAGK